MAVISFDLHTHTTYSHGKGSIEDNAAAAAAAGLKTLGISDHGPGHRGFGLKMSEIPNMRRDIEQAKKDHPGLEILLGVEANIINRSGALDVSKEDIPLFDYIIAGYHYGVFGEEPLRAAIVHAGGFWYRLAGSQSKAARIRNTALVTAAIESNPVKIVSHPGEKADFDIDAIARCCEERGTWMEINDHHECLTVEGIRTAMKYDVTFILGSDAHVPRNVGMVERALARAEQAGLDLSRIVNYRRD
ncbi:MAG: PHP domain-containing protein [Firmicutes bacterium]|nr:PHP domain-containing protein [Bacillota bacterium]